MLFTDLSSERVVNALSKVGFKVVKQGKHIGMSDGYHRVTIPRHKRINPYTLKSIIKSAGITDEKFLEDIFRNIIRKQYPEVWDFLYKYLDQWIKREDWLEHEIILNVLCQYFQKSNVKLDCLHNQIMVANSRLVNVDEFKQKLEELHKQSYSRWEDWYAELRAIEYLKKEKNLSKFKCIKEGNKKTPEFEAWRNNDRALVEVKHKHFSDECKIFEDFNRKFCAESVRDEILRKTFGSNLQKNPNEFKKLLESKDEWGTFIKGLKEKIQLDERGYTYSEQIKIDWLDGNGEFGLSDQLRNSLLPRLQPQNVIDRRGRQTELQNKFSERIKAVVDKAISQMEGYEKRVNDKFHIKYIICFVKLNIPVALFLKDEINKVSIIRLKNEIESNHQNTILEIVI